jgi:multiple antibiotic resistance protein
MDLNFAIYSFTALFIIVNPIAIVPIVMAITERFKKEHRKEIVRRAVLIATVVLIFFTYTGNAVFKLLGVEIYSFRIAGGILLFIIAIEMLFGKRSRTESSAEEEEEAIKQRDDVAVTPLAIPLLTGPGAITTGIVLINNTKGPADEIVLLINILLVFLLSYLILSRSERVFEALGNTGTRVIVRIMGLLLASIAVQFIITGIGEAILGIK